jgi:protein SCO1/2
MMMKHQGISRRAAIGVLGGSLLASGAVAQGLPTDGPADRDPPAQGGTQWHDLDITGTAPGLSLRMQATPDGRTVTQDAFRGHVTMLYFGYTSCPDVCPLVMQNVVAVLAQAKQAAAEMRFLFVTVDPGRDTNTLLAGYVQAFGPQFTGLRGDDNALERLARRYRVAYSVTPNADPSLYEVSHSDSIFVFDRQLNARLLVPSMATQSPDIDGVARDLTRLVNEKPSAWDWLRGLV